MSSKIREILDEFKGVVRGRAGILDTVLPPILFLLMNTVFDFQAAVWSAAGLAVIVTAIRLLRKEKILYALGGMLGAGIAVLLARLLDRAEGFLLPSILSSAFTAILCLISPLVGRPVVALTSYIARRWPLEWYWHPRVRPAYNEVTLFWAVFFGWRGFLQWSAFQGANLQSIAWIQLLSGWPATIVLLILSYLYGTWRLRNLRGPSVEEFRRSHPAPWTGQVRGF